MKRHEHVLTDLEKSTKSIQEQSILYIPTYHTTELTPDHVCQSPNVHLREATNLTLRVEENSNILKKQFPSILDFPSPSCRRGTITY